VPLLTNPDYRPGPLFGNAHAATTLPTLLRRVALAAPRRVRVGTPDDDFLDLDCWWQGAEPGAAPGAGRPTVVLCHGLEGNARRQYMLGMARAFLRRGWNVAGCNYRGCGGEPNRRPRSYHSGATDDLRAVLQSLDRADRPVRALVGFSLGGNLVLRYLGEDPASVLPGLQAAVAVSTPADLESSERCLRRSGNRLYLRRFLRKLAAKIRVKAALFPGQVDAAPLERVRWLRDFDDLYTAPLHGFRDAAEYYARCSSRPVLPAVRVPTLMISAADDPFLGEACYPRDEASASHALHLEIPACGGHVGFRAPGGEYWSEARASAFVAGHSSQV
jgi:predicted alpha/beta-fold hydrolase